MEIGRSAIYGLVVMMSINAAAVMIQHIGIEGTPLPAWNQTNVEDALNATKIVEGAPGGFTFYDIVSGLTSFWDRSIPIIESFPGLLAAYGCPDFIYNPLHNIWRFMWVTFVALVVIAGRRV